MIGDHYTNAKTAVLDVCNRYFSFLGDAEEGVDAALLKGRVKALTEGRFVLVVAGEVKAGKSTFINALLGERILPTDILQSSSAVVEIFKSDKKHVKIYYADGHSETVHDDPETLDHKAFECLRQIGAIKDEYRSIPTTLIDARIVKGSIKPGYPLPIDELEEASNSRLQDKEELIQKYVNIRTLADIPEKITFGFPLKYAFDGFRLVDSPGVNARGGVQDATYAYIQEANAVLFVHSLESPIESTSFYDFITKVLPNHARDMLFLVLTKSGGKSEIEIGEKIRETRQQYDKEFDQHRILHVDSMLKIVSDEIKDFDSARALRKHYREQRKQFEAKYREQSQEWRGEVVNFDIKLKLLNYILDEIDDDPDHEAVQSAMLSSSNFDELERVIDEFSARAPRTQLSSLLDSVMNGYDNQITRHEQNLDALKKKRKHPQTFENEISEIQSHLNEYQHSMNEFAKDITSKFTGVNASYLKSLKQIEAKYCSQIGSALTSDDTIKRDLANFHDEMSTLADKKESEVRSEFEDELRRLGEKFKAEYSITVPTVDISSISAKANEDAYQEREVPRDPKGFWEWTWQVVTLGIAEFREKQTVYDSQAYLDGFKSGALKALQEHTAKFPGLLSSLIDNFRKEFQSSLRSLIESRNKELEDIKMRRATNEEILTDIATAEQKKKDIAAQMTRISDMLGDLR